MTKDINSFKTGQSTIESLPNELLIELFNHIDMKSLVILRRTSKYMFYMVSALVLDFSVIPLVLEHGEEYGHLILYEIYDFENYKINK